MGDVQGRHEDTYVFKWTVASTIYNSQSFVLQAVAKDNDGNIVRSGTLAGLTADNSGNRPKVEIDNIFVDQDGVKIRALAESGDADMFFGGISRVRFYQWCYFDAIGVREVLLRGLDEYIMNWKPDRAGTYTIHAMAVGSVGLGDHYTMSEPFIFDLTEEQLAQFSTRNAGPSVQLISRSSCRRPAIARAYLEGSSSATESSSRKLDHNYGFVWPELSDSPEVQIFGGGGTGATAETGNQAITSITLTNGGSGYSDD